MQVELKRLQPKNIYQLRSTLTESTAKSAYIEWPFTKEVANSFISSYNTWGIWINNGILVGAIEVKKDLETAYFVSELYRNLGIATKAVGLCKQHFGDKQLWCVINPDNQASLKVANNANLRVSFIS
jgi:RimJ/RimL family protein N-acetyltransferase|tara:strand:+ start:5792 stop:6172 length:381 start_codon:yes stop_codon:yes gene_type:complete